MAEACENCGTIPRKRRHRCPDCDELVCSKCWRSSKGKCKSCGAGYSAPRSRRSSSYRRTDREWGLHNWRNESTVEVHYATDGTTTANFLGAIRNKQRVQITYRGGSTPGTSRWIRPERVFRKGGDTYVEAYCESRHESRRFNVNQATILTTEALPAEPPTPPRTTYTQPPPQTPSANQSSSNTSSSDTTWLWIIGVGLVLGLLHLSGC